MTYLKVKVLLCLLLSSSINLFAQSEPNIIIILTDDQSWTASSVQMDPNDTMSKSDFFETPNLEEFANTGMIFTQGYASAPKCSPTRCSILTGQSTSRNSYTYTANTQEENVRLLEATTITALPTSTTTIAEWLKTNKPDYVTGHFGKWHLKGGGPEAHGFDFGDGATGNAEGNHAEAINNDPKLVNSITASVIDFMTNAKNQSKPFFVQVSHHAPRKPEESTQASYDEWSNNLLHPLGTRHNNSNFAAMIADLDTSFGLLLDALGTLDITDNTYVFFVSDNGGGGNNNPLKGGKASCHEGGIRVPFIVSGPQIPSGVYNSNPVVTYDLFPTIVALTDGNAATLPNDLDGINILPTLLDQNEIIIRNNSELIFHSPHYAPNVTPLSAIIDGNYKLVADYNSGNLLLFDLDTDISETTDLSETYPLIKLDLAMRLRDYLKSVNANMVQLNSEFSEFNGTADDADEDGLPDSWEFRELLTTAYNNTDDPDGDDISNADEYLNSTDPLINLNNLSIDKFDDDIVRIYPNPNNGIINLSLTKAAKATIYNISGKLIENFELKLGDNSISIKHYPSGIYILKSKYSNGNSFTKKIIVK